MPDCAHIRNINLPRKNGRLMIHFAYMQNKKYFQLNL